MTTLTLDVRLDGFADRVGTLARESNGNALFKYDETYLAKPNAIPVSLSLPLTDAPYGDQSTRAYFENLLQEGDSQTRNIRDREGLATDDVVGLLALIGKDCPGAVSIVPEGAPPVKVPGDFTTDYNAISEKELHAIIASLHRNKMLPKDTVDPSPLAGVQSKFAFTVLPNGQYAFAKPGSGAPSTHIIKVPGTRYERDARDEAEAMRLTRLVNGNVARSRLLKIAEIEVLEVERFDRTLDERGRIARVHQEDFAQALGLPAALKYERNGKGDRKFDSMAISRVLSQTETPALAREEFILTVLSDLMLGNVDGHAKNHSLLYSKSRPALAPRYDVLPTRLNSSFTDELSFKIGNAERTQDLQNEDIRAFFHAIGVTGRPAQARIMHSVGIKIAKLLGPELDQLGRSGMKSFADLIAANMRLLFPLMNVQVPSSAENGDAFIVGVGAWLTS